MEMCVCKENAHMQEVFKCLIKIWLYYF